MVKAPRRCSPPDLFERNTRAFALRYASGNGSDASFRDIGRTLGISGERVRQVLELERAAAVDIDLPRARFDELRAACATLEPMPAHQAEARLALLLGPGQALASAIDYGEEVLRASLGIHWIARASCDAMIAPGTASDEGLRTDPAPARAGCRHSPR